MKKFLVLYHAPISAMQQMAQNTPEQAKAGMDAWMAWGARAGSAIVEMGTPLGVPAMVKGGGGGADMPAGYSIMQGADEKAVVALFAEHPHLMIPGATITVQEMIPLPAM